MSVILVIEQDASYAERILETLRQEGWAAKRLADRDATLEAASTQRPRLVIASASQPSGTRLLQSFSRKEGGPGSVALVPGGLASRVTAEDFQADEVLAKPFSDEDLKQIVRRCLATPSATSEAPKIVKKSRQLTSAEIFGDVLAEVEAEAQRAKIKRPTKARPAEDLEKKLEETLSGVFPVGDRLKRPGEAAGPSSATAASKPGASPASVGAPARKDRKGRTDLPTDFEIDNLLDKTLSSLELPSRPRKTPKSSTPAALTSPAQVSPAPPSEPPATSNLDTPGPAALPPVAPTPVAPGSIEALGAANQPPLSTPPLPPADDFLPPAELTFDSPEPAAQTAETESGLWKGIEPPPDLFPSTFDAAPQVEKPVDAPLLDLQPEDFQISSPSVAGDSFSFTDSFVPPPTEPLLPGAQADPLSFTDTFIPPDPKESQDTSSLYPPAHEGSFPSYEPPQPASKSFLDDSQANAPATATGSVDPTPLGVGTTEPNISKGAGEPGTSKEEGQIFGDYTLLDRIATGGMAEVWRARRRGVEGFQKTVAIKKILGHLTDSPDFVNMFIDEAKLAAQLSHNNIIQIYDLGKEGDDFFIAMEHVDGKDLRSILTTGNEQGQPLPVGLAMLIVASLARALDYAHRRRDFEDRPLGLVHRDVSPQNVLISYEGEIKLCDFGIVKAVSKASTTQMGALKGKLQYMSPEQAWGKKVDGRSDIFSAGSVLFEVLTGTKLFTGDNEISVLDAVRECRIRSPLEIVPDLPPEVDEIVKKALAQAPEDRYQTAGDLEADLKAVLDNLRPPPSPTNLATYLTSIYSPQASTFPSYEVSADPQDTPASSDSDLQVEPIEVKAEASSSSGKKILVVLLVLLLLGGVGFAIWKLSGSKTQLPVDPASQETPQPPMAEAPTTQEAESTEVSSAGPPEETSTEDLEGAPPASNEAESTTADGESGQNLDLQQMVEEGLAEQEELLQQRLEEQYEAKRREIQEEISRTQESFKTTEAEASEPPPGGDG